MNEPTQQMRIRQTAPHPADRFPPRMRRTIIGVLLAILVALGAVVVLTGTANGDDADDGTAIGSSATTTTIDDDGDESDAIDDATEDDLDAADDSEGYPDSGGNVTEPPSGGGGSGDPVELEPVGGLDELCAEALGAGGHLVVTPDPSVLEPGDMTSALTIRNCHEQDVDWTAKTVPDVTLDTSGSTLAGGTTTQVGFTIDSDAHEPGAVEFKIKVSEPGRNHYVDVQAFRPTLGKDVAAGDNTFSAGDEAGGCANSCITKAWLTPNASTPDLGFEVRTHTPATIRVWVGTEPQDGGGAPMATSAPGTTQWQTVLKPLQPATTYHLLVAATDGNGKVDERSTTFKTVTPMDNPDDLAAEDPGCLAQCITKALLTPGGDFSVKHLEVVAKSKARFQAWVSTEAPTNGDVPSFDDTAVFANSGLQYAERWATDLAPLEGDTQYHIIVRAEDVDGHAAYQVGSFHTPAEPTHDVVITFHRVRVTHDGDSSWKNRGELSFAWGVGDTKVGSRGESKMSDGATFGFDGWKNTYVATGLRDDDFIPTVHVSGSERDADAKAEFCSMGTGVPHSPGSNGDCDAKWNVASSGLVSVGSIESLTPCSEHGIDGPAGDLGCLLLETLDQGDDYARFQVVVSYHVATP